MVKVEYEKVAERHIREELLIVDRTIDFLAPFFGIDQLNLFGNDQSKERWDSVNFPIVGVGGPSYIPSENLILIPLGFLREGSGSLGHEIGHWYHSILNPNIFDQFTGARFQDIYRHSLLETVANYSAVIYINGENPFENPEFELLELTNMNSDLPLNLLERVVDFDSELLRLRGVN